MRYEPMMMMMFRFGRRCRGLMLRSLGLNTLGTARHLPWSPVGLRRWLVDIVVSGRLSWLDAKTVWMDLVGNIAAGNRSLAVSLGKEGRMVTLVVVD